MAKAAFILLQVLTAIASLAGLALTVLISIASVFVGLLKGGANIFMAVAMLFLSGFQKTTDYPPTGAIVAPSVIALGTVFATMFVSVFLAG